MSRTPSNLYGVPACLPVVAVDGEPDVADRLAARRAPELGSPDDVAGDVDDLALGGLRLRRSLLGRLLGGGPLCHCRVPPEVGGSLEGGCGGPGRRCQGTVP